MICINNEPPFLLRRNHIKHHLIMLVLPLIRGDHYPCMAISFRGSTRLDVLARLPFHQWLLDLPILLKLGWMVQPPHMECNPCFPIHLNQCHTNNPLLHRKKYLPDQSTKLELTWSNLIHKISKEEIEITNAQIKTSEIGEETIGISGIMSH